MKGDFINARKHKLKDGHEYVRVNNILSSSSVVCITLDGALDMPRVLHSVLNFTKDRGTHRLVPRP